MPTNIAPSPGRGEPGPALRLGAFWPHPPVRTGEAHALAAGGVLARGAGGGGYVWAGACSPGSLVYSVPLLAALLGEGQSLWLPGGGGVMPRTGPHSPISQAAVSTLNLHPAPHSRLNLCSRYQMPPPASGWGGGKGSNAASPRHTHCGGGVTVGPTACGGVSWLRARVQSQAPQANGGRPLANGGVFPPLQAAGGPPAWTVCLSCCGGRGV